jgi:pimeloyl-ACP methyl ester carboxylesterase
MGGTTWTAPPSRWVDLDGPVHYVDYGGPADGPLMVCVHGLGGSLVNWAAVAPVLARTNRVLAVDLAGFGRTRGGGRSTAVTANRALLHRFLTEVAGTPAILVGNSMGGTISAMQAAAHPETVAGLVLIDPALPWQVRSQVNPVTTGTFAAYALAAAVRDLVADRHRPRTPDRAVWDVLRFCCVDPSRIPAAVVEQHVAAARARGRNRETDAELRTAARSLMGMLARRRQFAALLRRVRVPVLLLHGERDRLIPVGAARAAAAANPGWRLEVAVDIGHVPQLEAPAWTVARITEWLAAEGAPAAAHARAEGPPARRT